MKRPGVRRARRGLLALALITSTAIAASLPASGQAAPLTSTGRAVSVAGVLPILGPIAIADTGPVASSEHTVTQKSVVLLPIPGLLTVAAAHSVVETRSTSDGSLGASDVGALVLGVPGLPVLKLWGVASWSATTCRGSQGAATIALLQIGTRRIPVTTAPNTVIPLGVLSIAINEQRTFTTADGGKGLTVTAVHVFGLGINLFVASATSDMHGCPTGPSDSIVPTGTKVF